MIEILTYYNGSKVSEIRTSGTLEGFAVGYPKARLNRFKNAIWVTEKEVDDIQRTLIFLEVDDDRDING